MAMVLAAPSAIFARVVPAVKPSNFQRSSFTGIKLSHHSPMQHFAAHSAALPIVCKLKTHKATAKRFRVTGSGILVRRRAGKQHLLANKNAKRRKRLSKMVPVNRRDYPGIVRACPYMKVKRKNILRSARKSLLNSTRQATIRVPDSEDQSSVKSSE